VALKAHQADEFARVSQCDAAQAEVTVRQDVVGGEPLFDLVGGAGRAGPGVLDERVGVDQAVDVVEVLRREAAQEDAFGLEDGHVESAENREWEVGFTL